MEVQERPLRDDERAWLEQAISGRLRSARVSATILFAGVVTLGALLGSNRINSGSELVGTVMGACVGLVLAGLGVRALWQIGRLRGELAALPDGRAREAALRPCAALRLATPDSAELFLWVDEGLGQLIALRGRDLAAHLVDGNLRGELRLVYHVADATRVSVEAAGAAVPTELLWVNALPADADFAMLDGTLADLRAQLVASGALAG